MPNLNRVRHIAIICPARPSYPEALGLRHLAFEANSITDVCTFLKEQSIYFEPVRVDNLSGKQFTFVADPDGLPIEFYEK